MQFFMGPSSAYPDRMQNSPILEIRLITERDLTLILSREKAVVW